MTHESDSWWEIPWIAYFVSLFKHPFNITEFSILEFEDSLNKDDQASQLFFTDLIIELLRGLYQNPKIDESSYEGKPTKIFLISDKHDFRTSTGHLQGSTLGRKSNVQPS
jgi:hypothetical protein